MIILKPVYELHKNPFISLRKSYRFTGKFRTVTFIDCTRLISRSSRCRHRVHYLYSRRLKNSGTIDENLRDASVTISRKISFDLSWSRTSDGLARGRI